MAALRRRSRPRSTDWGFPGGNAAAGLPCPLALSIPGLVDRHFPCAGIEQVLSSRLLWLPDHGRSLPPHAVVRWLREAHVRDDSSDGGYDERLRALAARLQARAASRAKEKKDPAAATELLEQAARTTAEIQEVRARVRSVIEAIRSLPERATFREHGEALLALVDRWGMPRRLARGEGDAGDDGPTALDRAAALALARDQAALALLREADRAFARADWTQALTSALAEASLPPGGARGGAVQLAELRELPARRFDHVLVVGLVDGELPATAPVDPLLSDEDRRAVNRAAGRPVFRAPAGEDESVLLPPRQAEEPLLFQLGVASATCSAWLFWPRSDARGRQTLRSPFVDESVRALGLSPEEDRACAAPLSPVPALADCRSRPDLLARTALEAFADAAWRISPPLPRVEAAALAAACAESPLGPRLARVARAALAERERLRAFVDEAPAGRFSGKLSDAALRAIGPELRFGPDAPLSAHQLEEYTTCGFRTLAHRVLNVQQEEPGEDDLAARDRGSLLHRCLERFFRRLDFEGRLPLRGDPEELRLLEEVAAAEMELFAAEEHVGRRPLWELRRAEVLRTLQAIIEAETRPDATPVEFERRFGYDGSWDALRIPNPGGTEVAYVRGAIDRIDRERDGRVLVIDYKSSGKQSLSRKLQPAGLLAPEFQLAIYAALLRQREPRTVIDAVYVSLRDAERSRTLREATGQAVDFESLLEMDPVRRATLRTIAAPPLNLADEVWGRVTKMRRGIFTIQPLSCDFCELKPACRIVALPPDPEENGTSSPTLTAATPAPHGRAEVRHV